MLEKYLHLEARSIVLLGNFNPSIFHPAWFASKGLIPDCESESAKIEVVTTEITRFEIGDWLKVEILRNRCEFKTFKKPYFPILKDLVISIFNILKETPIDAVGFNIIYGLSLVNKQNYFSFGNKLAPLSIWDDFMLEPRLNHLEIVSMKQDGDNFVRRIDISPANPEFKLNFGVSANVNNHLALTDGSNRSEERRVGKEC